MIFRALLVGALFLPAIAAAQDLERPAGWVVRTEDPENDPDAALWFVAMPPGWHVTTGPAVVLYDPDRAVEGSFRVEAETYLFPGESESGFGLFLGGDGMNGPRADYFVFLVDRRGRFELHHRMGEEVHPVVERAAHPAVAPWTEGTAKNVLTVEVRPDTVRYFVNGQRVAAYEPRPDMGYDGVVGLVAGADVNLHVSRLDVTPLDEEVRDVGHDGHGGSNGAGSNGGRESPSQG